MLYGPYVINKDNSPIKEEQDIWAMFELKRGNSVSSDRAKFERMLAHFPDCAFGAAFGIAELPNDDWLDNEAEKEGPNLVRCRPKMISGRTFLGFGYIHENPIKKPE